MKSHQSGRWTVYTYTENALQRISHLYSGFPIGARRTGGDKRGFSVKEKPLGVELNGAQ
jgi:hypothetical protein